MHLPFYTMLIVSNEQLTSEQKGGLLTALSEIEFER